VFKKRGKNPHSEAVKKGKQKYTPTGAGVVEKRVGLNRRRSETN